ncbi:MAG: hypothetical protein RI910_1495 [Verrucomicrobiota bacterium]
MKATLSPFSFLLTMKPTLPLLAALLLVPLAALQAAEPPATFCNPLPIPNYPIGFSARNAEKGKRDTREAWILGYQDVSWPIRW